jgi:S-adenosylmethionine hydrolase
VIVLLTDFGADDIYVGQLKAALIEHSQGGTPIVDLLHSVPVFRLQASAHLLAALQARFPAGTVFLTVVDPGVGTRREPVVLQAHGKWYVGPDNGLLSVVAARANETRTWHITWRPPQVSASFHGRDLFAPIAARIARGDLPAEWIEQTKGLGVRFSPDDLAEVIHIDHYGNALSGVRAAGLARTTTVAVAGRRLAYARVFAEAPAGSAFWYENSLGLVEIAADRASAAALLGIEVGAPLSIVP